MRLAYACTHTRARNTLQISYPSDGRTHYFQAGSHCLSSNDRFPLSHCKQDTMCSNPMYITMESFMTIQNGRISGLCSSTHTITTHKGWSNRPPHTQQRKQSGIWTNNNIRATKFEYAELFSHQRVIIKISNTGVQNLGLALSLFQNFCKHFPSQRFRIVLL
jgi:hypothetical protein